MQQPQQPAPYPPQDSYPPSYPGSYPPQQQQPVVVVQQPTPVVIYSGACGPTPFVTTCPSCQRQVSTVVNYEVGAMTWVICVVLAVLGCWPCCLIPFCVAGCKDVTHTCPNCQHRIGMYKRM